MIILIPDRFYDTNICLLQRFHDVCSILGRGGYYYLDVSNKCSYFNCSHDQKLRPRKIPKKSIALYNYVSIYIYIYIMNQNIQIIHIYEKIDFDFVTNSFRAIKYLVAKYLILCNMGYFTIMLQAVVW